MRIRISRATAVAAIALAGLAVSMPAAAQDQAGMPWLGPSLGIVFGAVPDAGVSDDGQRFGHRDLGVGASIPVKGGWEWDGADISGFRLLIHGGFRADSVAVPFWPDRRSFYAMELGVSGLHVLGRDNQITWSVGGGFAEDSDTVSSPEGRLVGRVVALHRSNEHLTLLYGGAYSFILGRGRLLPIFGILWRPRPGTTVSVLGPFSARVHHRINNRVSVGAQAGLRGNQYHVANNQQFSSPDGKLHLRVRELRVGGEIGIVLGRSLALVGEAGVATARHLAFADGKMELSSSTAGTQPYVSVGLRVSFSSRSRRDEFGRW